jgi:hypothetical protein
MYFCPGFDKKSLGFKHKKQIGSSPWKRQTKFVNLKCYQ